jgi:hypothetical protein
LHYGASFAANPRFGWFCVLSPEGCPSVWKVHEKSIECLGNRNLDLPPDDKYGFLNVDLSFDEKILAVCKTVYPLDKPTSCETFFWDLGSGTRLPVVLQTACTGIGSIAFIDNQHIVVRAGSDYEIANIYSGATVLVASNAPAFKSRQHIYIEKNTFLLLGYAGRNWNCFVDRVELLRDLKEDPPKPTVEK